MNYRITSDVICYCFFATYILYAMAVTCLRGGRPYAVAEINFDNDRKLQLLNEFYNVCNSFNYRDMMALSRALGVCFVTVARWKYKITFPRWDTAIDVIEWVNCGKPIRLESSSRDEVSMLP
jgi:hypothetical protein